ncbi:MAG: hypothetical protein ACOC80_12800 [Petrotogales bacterium]
MSEWIIKKGNTAIQDILVKDADGDAVSNLASADEIKFHIKTLETETALVEKTVGAGIEVDTPSTGYLRLTLTATDTSQVPKTYYMGLQITWGTEIRELILKVDGIETEKLKITQDIVNT